MSLPDLGLYKVLDEYRVNIKLPDRESKLREQAMNKLKDKGCTKFEEVRWYDIKEDFEMITIVGYVLELLQTYHDKPLHSPDWS